jgi:hypothetical protein
VAHQPQPEGGKPLAVLVHHWYWWLIPVPLGALIVAAVLIQRRMFGGASTFVHDNGTVLRIDGTVRTEDQRAAILSFMEMFSADPEDPSIERGLRELGYTVTYLGRPQR